MERNASQRYLRQHVLSASPAGLVAMLLDRAVALLNEVVEAIAAGHIERRWKANAKATEIVCHLWETLDMARGGEIAARLEPLYNLMVRRLSKVDLENDPQAARDVIALLEPLQGAWRQIAESGRTTAAGGEAAASAHTSVTISA